MRDKNDSVAGGVSDNRGSKENEVSYNLPQTARNVKARLAEYLKAKGVEPNSYGFIRCPWHEDKTPSCKVNEEYLYCFSCGESGDIYKAAAALIGVPHDREHFREAAADVEKTLGIPEWKPPARRGDGRFKLSQSAVYRNELLKQFGKALDAGDEEQAVFTGTLILALDKLPEAT